MVLVAAAALVVGLGGVQRLWQTIGFAPAPEVEWGPEREQDAETEPPVEGALGHEDLEPDLVGGGRPSDGVVRRWSDAGAGSTGRLVVVVLDEQGLPIDVEHVVAERAGRSELLDRIGPDPSVPAGDPLRGAVRYRAQLPIGSWLVRARGPQVGEATVRAEVALDRVEEVAVVCDDGLRLSGVVVDERSRPVEGATVEVRVPAGEGRRSGEGEATVVRVGRTHGGGRFDFARLPRGPLWLMAHTETASLPAPGLACDGRDLHVRLVLASLGRAVFQLETFDGRSLPESVRVMVGRVSRPTATRVRHVAVRAGRVEVAGLSGDLDEIVVDVEGYAAVARRVTAAAGETVDLGVVVVTAGHSIAGRVLSDAGGPVVGARLRAAGGRCLASSGADGAFLLSGVPEGEVGLSIEAEGYEAVERKVEVSAKAPTGDPVLEVRLQRVAIVVGLALSADGEPAESLRLEFHLVVDGDARPGPVVALRTDEDGSFSVELPPGRYRVAAHEPPAAPTPLGEVVASRGEASRLSLRLPR